MDCRPVIETGQQILAEQVLNASTDPDHNVLRTFLSYKHQQFLVGDRSAILRRDINVLVPHDGAAGFFLRPWPSAELFGSCIEKFC